MATLTFILVRKRRKKNCRLTFLEHIYGHHKNVATPLDVATARLNESVYHFIPRSSIGGYLNAWKIEAKRLRSKGVSFWNVFENRMFRYTAAVISLPTFLYFVFGFTTFIWFIVQALISIFLIEVVNYIGK